MRWSKTHPGLCGKACGGLGCQICPGRPPRIHQDPRWRMGVEGVDPPPTGLGIPVQPCPPPGNKVICPGGGGSNWISRPPKCTSTFSFCGDTATMPMTFWSLVMHLCRSGCITPVVVHSEMGVLYIWRLSISCPKFFQKSVTKSSRNFGNGEKTSPKSRIFLVEIIPQENSKRSGKKGPQTTKDKTQNTKFEGKKDEPVFPSS